MPKELSEDLVTRAIVRAVEGLESAGRPRPYFLITIGVNGRMDYSEVSEVSEISDAPTAPDHPETLAEYAPDGRGFRLPVHFIVVGSDGGVSGTTLTTDHEVVDLKVTGATGLVEPLN